jgi:WD40 repeat protein
LAVEIVNCVKAFDSYGTQVRVWDAASAEPRCMLRGHGERVTAVAWHPAAGLLTSGHPNHGEGPTHHTGHAGKQHTCFLAAPS